MLTRSGVTLLDFGLARLALTGSSSEHVEQGDARLSSAGVILGTLHYLSPEQLNGGKSDGRSDIFAFGAVLHEMLTAQRAFDGASRAMVIAAILEHAPSPVSDVQRAAPAALDRLIRKALAKDPDERWQDAGDLRDELKWIAEDASNAHAKPSVTSHLEAREIVPWVLFATASRGAVGSVCDALQRATGEPGRASAHFAHDDGCDGHGRARHRRGWAQPGDHARRYASRLCRQQ